MLTNIKNFFYMGGHGFYVWSAYSSVLFYLGWQWLVAVRQWKKVLRKVNYE